MDIKLNKNQRKFFIRAVEHFGEDSTDVRLKDLNDFADNAGLIVPTSALKNFCHEEGQVRGHYNLTMSGIKPTVIKNSDLDYSVGMFNIQEDVIIDTPAFVDDAPKKEEVRFIPKKGDVPIQFNNPVYVVQNSNSTPIAVCQDPKAAYESRILSLHDQGTKGYNEVKDELDYRGRSRIGSNNSQLWCEITVMELK